MAKRNNIMKVLAFSTLLLFLISGFSVISGEISVPSIKDQKHKSFIITSSYLVQDTALKITDLLHLQY